MKNLSILALFCLSLVSCGIIGKNRAMQRTESSHLSENTTAIQSTKKDLTALNSLKIENKGLSYKIKFFKDSGGENSVIISPSDSIFVKGAIESVEHTKTEAKSEAVDSTAQKEESSKKEAKNVEITRQVNKRVKTSTPFLLFLLAFLLIIAIIISIFHRKKLSAFTEGLKGKISALYSKIKTKISLWKW